MKLIIIILTSMLILGCASSQYQKSYKPYVDAKQFPSVEILAKNQEPKIFGTNDYKRDIHKLRSKKYLVIGRSYFKGPYETNSLITAQAKRIGATVVLIDSKYASRQSATSEFFFPNSSLSESHKKIIFKPNSQEIYNQRAVFFLRFTKKMKFGVFFKPISATLMEKIQRNTGAVIDVIVENTPAFNSALLPNDVLIKIDNTLVENPKHAGYLMKNIDNNASSSVLTVIRNKQEKTINIIFND